MSEPAQTTLPLHSSLAAFVPLVIAALLCSALLALRAACVCRVRACCHVLLCATFTRVRGCVMPQRAEARRCSNPLRAVCPRFPPCVLCSPPLCLLTRSHSLSLSLTHFRFGERVGEVPSIARATED